MLFYCYGDMMNNKDVMIQFINEIHSMGMLTEFIKYVFDYECLYDYNYIFRIIDDNNQVIIDIYDNVSVNRFNRYIFDFVSDNYKVITCFENDVFVKKISIVNLIDNDDIVLKLGYLFKLDKNLMIKYACQFLDIRFVKILECVIENKPIL